MSLTRRRFIQLIGGSAAATGILGWEWLGTVKQALAQKSGNLPVIWLQAQSCAGCSISTLNAVHPDIAEVLTETISLEFHPNIMGAAGNLAIKVLEDTISQKRGKFVLIVEGSIPTLEEGLFSTMNEREGKPISTKEWVERLGGSAKTVLNVGTCASFGGIPAGKPNPTGAKSVSKILPNAMMINIPGCPSHPAWVVGTIAHILLFGIPELDEERRPKMFFSEVVHERCERRSYFEDGKFAKDFGDAECMYELGCKGPISYCDVPIRGWNNNVNWCVRNSSPCIGCTDPEFPDFEREGLYVKLPISKTYGIPWSPTEEIIASIKKRPATHRG